MSRLSSTIAACVALLILGVSGSASPRSMAPDKASVERGHVTFDQHCAVCHGKNAKGHGRAASTMTTKPADLTEMQKRYGAFFRAKVASAVRGTDPVVAHVPGMMVWSAIFRADAKGNEVAVDARIEDLVAFLETLQEE